MVGIPHPHLDYATRRILVDLRPGGVILFGRNYTDLETLTTLCEELHAINQDNPPLVAIDHEGGRVHRLTPPFTHFPPAAHIGHTHSPDLAYQVGLAMGRELQAVGIDLDFAPVLDVFSNPDNTVIGDRAFSTDPHQVARFGCALARGLREAGVIPCGKHFPGHGATLLDSHHDLPRDERAANAFEEIDLIPFRRACQEHIEMIMTAHVLYPALDPERPATLSPHILTDLLRKQLGFSGVIVSDDLEMGAIVHHSSVEQAAVDALSAGADLLLVCQTPSLAISARAACLRAVETGRIPQERVIEASQRLAQLKAGYQHHRTADRRQIGQVGQVGTEEHQRLVEKIQRAVG